MPRPSVIPGIKARLEAYLDQKEVEYLTQPEPSRTPTLPSVPEDAANPPGRTVTDLFLPRFNDSRDQVTDGSSGRASWALRRWVRAAGLSPRR